MNSSAAPPLTPKTWPALAPPVRNGLHAQNRLSTPLVTNSLNPNAYPSARESHTSELAGLRCAYSELAAESKRATYALSGQTTTANAPSPAETELRRDADSMELRHSLLIAGHRDRITQIEDYSLRQRTAILERDQYIQYLRRHIATISQANRARARSLLARPVSTDAHPASDDACPPGPFLLGTAPPGTPGDSSVPPVLPPGLGALARPCEQPADDYDPEDSALFSRARAELALSSFVALHNSQDPCLFAHLGIPVPTPHQPHDSGAVIDSPECPDCVSPPRYTDQHLDSGPVITGPPAKLPGPTRPPLKFPPTQPPKPRPHADPFAYHTLHPANRRKLIRARLTTESPNSSDSE